MYLESVHKTFKYSYLKGKKNKRLDRCITELIKFTRDNVFKRLHKLSKNKCSLKEDCIVRSHLKGTQINKSQITFTSTSSWLVQSSKDNEVSYRVLKTKDTCDDIDCKLKCRQCDVCTHIYTCECPDHVVRCNICKHIHACILANQTNLTPKKNDKVIPICDDNPVNRNYDLIQKSIDNKSKFSKLDNLKMKMHSLLGCLDYHEELTEEEFLKVEKCIDLALKTVNKKRKIGIIERNEPANKNIEKQKRFKHKKQKHSDESLSLASYNEKKAIINSLNSNGEVMIIHSSDDHNYCNIYQ